MNRQLLAAVVSGALVLPMAAQGVEISASGHINRALVFTDLTGQADVTHRDAGSSPSRFRFSGIEELDNGLTIGANVEYGVWSADSAGTVRPNIRQANASLGGEFGTLTLGQASPATNIIAFASFDNYAWLSGVEIGCDLCFTGAGGPFLGDAYGSGRAQIVKYDTPAIGPAKLSGSMDGNDFWDVAVRVSGEGAGFQYKLHAGLASHPAAAATPTATLSATPGTGAMDTSTATGGAYVVTNPGSAAPEAQVTTVAGALAFPLGVHANAAFIQRNPDIGASTEMVHFGIGYNIGDTSLVANFTDSEHSGGGNSWGVGVGHAMGSMELYAGYKHLDFDAAASEDYGIFVIGTRVMFN